MFDKVQWESIANRDGSQKAGHQIRNKLIANDEIVAP